MDLQERRQQAFLQKKSHLDKFTLTLIDVYGFSKEKVQNFVDTGFIKVKTIPMCSNCFTSKTHYEYGDVEFKDVSIT